ncbi:MAG: sulfatase [bacterium]|nr:sulfatase [bacterium]
MQSVFRFYRLAVLLIALFLGCGPSEEQVLFLDLLADLPALEKTVETRTVDFGSTEARSQLHRGFTKFLWDMNRELPFVRGEGRRSVVRFALLEARDLELVLRGRPVPKSAPAQVEIAVNAKVLRKIELKPKFRRYRIKLPASALRRGENRLYLTYSGQADAVAWYEIGLLSGVASARPPAVIQSSRSLFLPFGSQVTVPFFAPPGAELRFDEISVRGAGLLKVQVRRDGAPDETYEQAESIEDAVFAFGGEDWTAVRLTLTALPGSAGGERDGISLVEPGVWGAERFFGAVKEDLSEDTEARPNVIIYLVDTLRADHLGCYGYERPEGPISPRIDEFAAQATLFENSVANTSWTRPAVATIFTGMWPAAHQVNRTKDQLAPQTTTLAEVLQEAGYETVGFIANPNAWRRFGLGQGFDVYQHITGDYPPSSRRINSSVAEWLDGRQDDKPFLLYVHTVDPHDPYNPPPEFRERFAPGTEELLALPKKERWRVGYRDDLVNLYDGEIAHNDESFGLFVDDLEARGLWRDSIVIFVSDHGEEFQEHGSWTHGRKLFSESIRVPLIIKWPGQSQGQRRADLAQQIDIPSTVLSELALPWPGAFEGRDLAVSAAAAPPTSFAYLNYYGPLQLSALRDDWKLMVQVKRQSSWLLDVESDPAETIDQALDHPVMSDALDALLEEALSPKPYWLRAGEAEIDAKLEEQLRALGYLD